MLLASVDLLAAIKILSCQEHFCLSRPFDYFGAVRAFRRRFLRSDQKGGLAQGRAQVFGPDAVFSQLPESFLGGIEFLGSELKYAQVIEGDFAELFVLGDA